MKLRLFVLLVCVYLAVASREPPWGDAHVVYDTTQRVVDHGKLDVELPGPPQFYAVQGKKKYGVFPLGNVFAMAPGYIVYKGLSKIPKAPADFLFRVTSHLPPTFLVAGVCALFFALARREGASERASFWMSLGLGLTSIMVIYARSPFSEALQTMALLWVVERGLSMGDRLSLRGALTTGLACGLLINTKLVYALVLPVLAIYVLWQQRREGPRLLAAAGIAAAPILVFAGIALWHNHLKTGDYLDTGYRIPEAIFSGTAYAALHGFFFSTGKSIFLYSPILVLGFLAWPSYYRRNRAHALFLLAVSAVVVLTNAKFRHWHADYCWGPRLLVPLTPVFLLPAAPWIGEALVRGRRRLRALGVGALVGAGLYVQLLGSAFYWDHYIRIAIAIKDQTGAGGWFQEDLHHCHFIPQFSPLVGHAWMLRHMILQDHDIMADPPWRRVIATKVNLTMEWGAVRPDWWVLEWGRTPGSLYWGIGIAVLLISVGTWAGLGIRRRMRTLGARSMLSPE